MGILKRTKNNMNAYTTIEESKQLIEAGLDVNTQDMYYQQCCSMLTGEYEWKPFIGEHIAIRENLFSYRNGYTKPCWSLAALLDIIDDNDIPYRLRNNPKSKSEYILSIKIINQEDKSVDIIDFDKVIGCITWLLENNYIKSNKNE